MSSCPTDEWTVKDHRHTPIFSPCLSTCSVFDDFFLSLSYSTRFFPSRSSVCELWSRYRVLIFSRYPGLVTQFSFYSSLNNFTCPPATQSYHLLAAQLCHLFSLCTIYLSSTHIFYTMLYSSSQFYLVYTFHSVLLGPDNSHNSTRSSQ